MNDIFYNIKNNYCCSKNYKINRINSNVNNILDDDAFIDPIIYDEINNKYKKTYYYEDNENSIWFIVKNKLDNKLATNVINRVRSFKKWNNNSNHNKIYIWITDFKKELPIKNKILNPSNINSASAVIYNSLNKNGEIFIWREEELLKVLLHELIHSLHHDQPLHNNKINKMIANKFNVNKFINVNESYTETLATLFNCMYLAIENDLDYIKLLEKEKKHSIHQVNKIIRYNGYNGLNQLYRKNSGKEFKQKTGVFSYYILKAALLNNIIEFIDFLRQDYDNKRYCKLLIKSFNKLIANNDNKYGKDNGLKMTLS